MTICELVLAQLDARARRKKQSETVPQTVRVSIRGDLGGEALNVTEDRRFAAAARRRRRET